MGNCAGGSYGTEDIFYVPEAGFSIPVRTVRKMGWKPDYPDHRDRQLVLVKEKDQDLPSSKDLRPKEHFEIYDQGDLGSCTANAICGAFHFDQVQEGLVEFVPSRLFVYYNERRMEIPPGEQDYDSGAYLRDGIKTVCQIGVCDEKTWPYNTDEFTKKPTSASYTEATKNKALEYASVAQDLEQMKLCIASGIPFVFGFTVYSSFFSRETALNGTMKMPTSSDTVAGGHAIMAVGYDDSKKVFIIRNSWGSSWGDKGYFYMPYDYIAQPALASDFWAIKTVSGKKFVTKKRHG
eukprot:CAMPEP_0206477622 /NCGR_PEP_ID=MMETSP0324_2-20121206/35513_1 /ASSEMBLY_ACC=CAM_ASM_000836 /TAXON_ID=2866 /ORGANISM="Crypthecodinium cohnii, Strain Seligo" /LENGTH=292 /DNA_ID=CAMNT_0053953663 /DNA_START=84 /DNA_END=962 /DNA_ORIENTATION=-